ncbi:MAG: patatin-like phospholipase family protein [Pseudomonadales bacterium]|nr:patatin-like phospholipase family protein [Pseudomonadales bacterium]MCP5171767.1 patatin-like phospholipase family protein [Pseudomonadales bacterium]
MTVKTEKTPVRKGTTGLILSGGGARAAYQVGVLKAVAEILPKNVCNPFPIICGTSAGSINALAIAGRAGHFRLRIRKLETIWNNLGPENVYRTDTWGVLKNSIKMLFSFLNSGYALGEPKALLDNEPLRELLKDYVRFRHVDEAIASGELQAVSVTAMSYTNGQSVCFFQGRGDLQPWERSRRVGVRTGLTVDHLMASSAIPTLFPARKIADGFYGDGAIRQLKPISPALHLGADKVFVIGVSDNPIHKKPHQFIRHSPSIAQIIGHMFNTAFIDSIESDLETLEMVNQLADRLSPEERAAGGIETLRPVKYLAISPSDPIDELAADYIKELPYSIRAFLRLTGATAHGGGISAASYLLFSRGFCRKLVELGYRDGMKQAEDIRTFFNLNTSDDTDGKLQIEPCREQTDQTTACSH